MTNADRIRAMTDEQLAFHSGMTCPPFVALSNKCKGEWNWNCYKCWLDWLKQEVEQ